MIKQAVIAVALSASLSTLVNAEKYESPKNVFGQPELGGVWSNATTTRFTRPKEFGDQLILTEEQAAKLEGRAEAYREAGNKRTDPNQGVYNDGNTNAGYNRFWTDPGTSVIRVDGKPRSSMVTFPENGQLPARKKTAAPYSPRRSLGGSEGGNSDNPENRGLSERCIFFNTSAGPVMRPTLYNNNYRLSQGRDAVVMVVEMSHEARIIRLNEKHNEFDQNKWMGDSVGRYEGNTLVVETINYHEQQSFFGASDKLKVTERFTRVADDRLLYQFTVEDPKTWVEPWGGEYEFWASPEQYEYACHEGNIGLEGILAGARREEQRAKEAKK